MNHTCPTCRKPGIKGLNKRWSSRGWPATCEHCGGLSHVAASTSNGIFVGGLLLFAVGCVVGAAAGSWWMAGLLGLVAAVAFNLWAWPRAEMFPIPKESARNARSAVWLLEGLYVLAAIFFN